MNRWAKAYLVLIIGIAALVANAATAQGLSLAAGAIAGSYSATAGVAAVGLVGPGSADASLVANNTGTATASVAAGFSLIPPIIPLAANGTSSSQNTTTVTPVVNLPAGGTGFAGGAGTGSTFAAVGVAGLFAAVGPIPVLPSILPLPPVSGALPAIP
jgi:hypothetical protein